MLALTLLLPWASAAEEHTEYVMVPILMYHSLYKTASNMWMLTPDEFEADLKYLAENGYTAVTVSQLRDYVQSGGELPEKPVVLTFDDGYYNNLSVALPLLEKYDMRMVLSIIGEYTDDWSETGGADSRYGHVTWEQLRQLVDSGRVEVSNHTQSLHHNDNGRKGVTRKRGEDLETYRGVFSRDVMLLQEKILEHCGVMPICFAFPYGSTCPEAREILRELGFAATLSCATGMNKIERGNPDCLFDLKRTNRAPGTSAAEILKDLAR